jgi:hypothetical protein
LGTPFCGQGSLTGLPYTIKDKTVVNPYRLTNKPVINNITTSLPSASRSPYRETILFFTKAILPEVLHVKLFFTTFLELMTNSRPSFWVCPIFWVIDVIP